MDSSYITKEVHKKFARRIEAENQRLEDENERQNRRLDAMEKEPAKDYKQIKATIITAIISTAATAIVGAIIAAIALL